MIKTSEKKFILRLSTSILIEVVINLFQVLLIFRLIPRLRIKEKSNIISFSGKRPYSLKILKQIFTITHVFCLSIN